MYGVFFCCIFCTWQLTTWFILKLFAWTVVYIVQMCLLCLRWFLKPHTLSVTFPGADSKTKIIAQPILGSDCCVYKRNNCSQRCYTTGSEFKSASWQLYISGARFMSESERVLYEIGFPSARLHTCLPPGQCDSTVNFFFVNSGTKARLTSVFYWLSFFY